MNKKTTLFAIAGVLALPYTVVAEELVVTSEELLPGSALEQLTQTQAINVMVAAAEVAPEIRAIADEIYAQLLERKTEFTVTYNGEVSKDTYKTIFDEAMSLALMKDEYINYDYSGYGYKVSYTSTKATYTVTVKYKQTYEQEQYVQQKIKRIIAAEVKPTMSVHQKIKVLHDYVVNHVDYDYTMNQAVNAPYFALKEGLTLCNGYAMLMYRLLNEVGVETRLISGDAGKEPIAHAWNLVKVEGQWYHLDATWNDLDRKSGDDAAYDYYMITDAVIAKDHFWQDGGLNGNEKPYPQMTAHYADQLLADNEVTLLKQIGQYVDSTQLVSTEQEFIDSLRFQMNRLRSNVEILYVGNETERLRENMTSYVTAANDGVYGGGYLYYQPVQISYRGDVVSKFKYEFSNYLFGIEEIMTSDIPVTMAVNETAPLTITMERTDKQRFDVSSYAEIESLNPDILKIGYNELIAQKPGVAKVKISYEQKELIKEIRVTGDEDASGNNPEPELPDEKELISYPFTGYKDFGEKLNVAPNKSWTIYMSKIITPKYEPQVIVMNRYGEEVDVHVQINGKKIEITPKAALYNAGETYYLKATFNEAKLNMSLKFTIDE